MKFNKVKLEDVSILISKGSTPRGKIDYSTNEKINFLRVKDLVDLKIMNDSEYTLSLDDVNKYKMKIWNKNTILVSIEGTIGKVAILGKQMCFNQAIAGIVLNEEIACPKYVMYYLNSVFNYSSIIKGTIMPALRLDDIKNSHINLPALNIQKKIAKILSDLDKKIELNNKIYNNLYEFTNNFFEAKILKNEERYNWKEYELSDISKMINGYSYKGHELTDKSDVGMATIKNFERTGGFKLDGFKGILPEKCKEEHFVKPYDVLVACTDLTQNADIIGNAILLLNNSSYKKVIMSMDLVKLNPTTDLVNNYMLYTIVNSKDFKTFALGYKSGTTVLHLNKNCFKEYTIKLPDEDVLKDLSKVIEANYKKMSQIIEENKRLDQLRDTLLPKLMNGEIDLDNIEI